MNQKARRIEWLAWGGLMLVIACILLAYLLAQLKFHAKLGKPLPVIGSVSDFSLTNQAGANLKLAELLGHVWVADIIFTRCPGPCLQMSRQMKQIEQGLPPRSTARLISLTTDPEFDTPPVLQAYAARLGADTNRWQFLTGPKADIAKLAVDSLKLIALDKEASQRESPQDLFIHSTIFVLVDKQGRLRGSFETVGDDVDPKKAQEKILAGVRRLERER